MAQELTRDHLGRTRRLLRSRASRSRCSAGRHLSARFNNENGFTFAQYGPRVPAIVISPLIPKNLVDHRAYDHASVAATLAMLFDMNPLTARAMLTILDTLIT